MPDALQAAGLVGRHVEKAKSRQADTDGMMQGIAIVETACPLLPELNRAILAAVSHLPLILVSAEAGCR